MYVSISGYHGFEKNELRKAANFFGVLLFPDKTLRSSIELLVQHDPELELEGIAFPDDNLDPPRHFVVSIVSHLGDPLHSDPIRTLAHEMVHCKQWASGEYCAIPAEKCFHDKLLSGSGGLVEFWKGEQWLPNEDEIASLDSPWETEAYGKEISLITKWLRFKQLSSS